MSLLPETIKFLDERCLELTQLAQRHIMRSELIDLLIQVYMKNQNKWNDTILKRIQDEE